MRSEIMLKDNKMRPIEDKSDTFAEKSFLANIKRGKTAGKSAALYLQILGTHRPLGFRILRRGSFRSGVSVRFIFWYLGFSLHEEQAFGTRNILSLKAKISTSRVPRCASSSAAVC